MGSAGFVILYVISIVATVMAGIIFSIYAARCFLVIVDQTAGGNDEVEWPDDPYVDYFGQSLHLVWLLIFSCVPAWAVTHLVIQTRADLFASPWWLFAIVIWLTFPIYLLSNLSGTGRWTVFHPSLFGRLVTHPGTMMVYFFMSAICLAAAVNVALFTYQSPSWLWVVLSPLLLTYLLFVYARLLGRTALLVSVESENPPNRPTKPRPSVRTVSSDPWSVANAIEEEQQHNTQVIVESESDRIPDETEQNEWSDGQPYSLVEEGTRTDWWERKTRSLSEDPGTYDLTDDPPGPRPEVPVDEPANERPVSEETLERELALRERKTTRKKHQPKWLPSLFIGVFEFPVYRQSLAPWLLLSMTGIGLSVLIRCMQLLQPR